MSIRPVGAPSTSSPSTPSTSPAGSASPATDDRVQPISATGEAIDDRNAVQLSGNLQALQRAVQDPSQDVSLAQVEAVRLEVLAGTYQPNTRAIADGLIASAQELLKTRSKPPRRSS